VADVFGDGAPGVLLFERRTALHYHWPGAAGQAVRLGLGRVVAFYHRASTLYKIH
jgi:hypothetical protein